MFKAYQTKNQRNYRTIIEIQLYNDKYEFHEFGNSITFKQKK